MRTLQNINVTDKDIYLDVCANAQYADNTISFLTLENKSSLGSQLYLYEKPIFYYFSTQYNRENDTQRGKNEAVFLNICKNLKNIALIFSILKEYNIEDPRLYFNACYYTSAVTLAFSSLKKANETNKNTYIDFCKFAKFISKAIL